MKIRIAFLLIPLILPVPSALADCNGEVAAVLAAMNAAGPIRREGEFIRDGALENKSVRDFSPPDQVIDTVDAARSGYLSVTTVSGKTAWSDIKHNGVNEYPVNEFDGSGWVEDTKKFRMPPYPITECPVDSGILKLVWTATDGEQSQTVTAETDAASHVMSKMDIITTLKDGTVETEEHIKFSSIAAFTVTPPADAVKTPSGPDYAKITDVEPDIPMSPDADKITYSKGIVVRYSSPQKLEALREFYRSKYAEMGWTEKDAKVEDSSYDARFVKEGSSWVIVQIEPGDGGSRVTVNGPYPAN